MEINFSKSGPPSKMTMYLRWVTRAYPGRNPDDPELRKRFEEALKEKKRMDQNWKNLLNLEGRKT